MKKLLLFFSILLLVAFYHCNVNAQVIVNEFSQGDNDTDPSSFHDHEWIELAVTQNGADLRGLYITSYSANSNAFPANGSFDLSHGIQLSTTNALFSNLSIGDVIVIYKNPTTNGVYDPKLGGTANGDGTYAAPTTDAIFWDDNGLMLGSNNSLIGGTWPGFKNANNDAICLYSYNSGTGLTGIFSISYGGSTPPTTSIFDGNHGQVVIPSGTSMDAGHSIYFTDSDPANAKDNTYWTGVSSYSASPKQLNGGANNSLPVELISFSASVKDNSVMLSWKTATEVNNYGFDVERTNGNDGWNKIGFVAGAGNSNTPNSYSFTDNPSGSTSFSYRLKQMDVDGNFKYYDAISVNLAASTEPELMQNNPNPFNPSTTIKFYIPNISDVTIRIYDMLGREVTTLFDQQATAGFHNVYWNGKDSRGESVSSGVYLYRLTAGNFSETKKMNLLK